MTCLYLLINAALRAGEGPDLPRAEGGDYGGLVPLEDVGALFAPLPKGHHRAPLVDYQAPLNLYRHVVSRPSEDLPSDHRDVRKRLYRNLRLLPAAAREHHSTRSID